MWDARLKHRWSENLSSVSNTLMPAVNRITAGRKIEINGAVSEYSDIILNIT